MAVFKAPRLNSTQRASLTLEVSEIVYDTDQNIFYGGNGVDIGGFPLGFGGGSQLFVKVLTQTDIDNKYVILPDEAFYPDKVRLNIIGGIEQLNGVDYQVIDDVLSWNGLGLDNFLEVGETLLIQY